MTTIPAVGDRVKWFQPNEVGGQNQLTGIVLDLDGPPAGQELTIRGDDGLTYKIAPNFIEVI